METCYDVLWGEDLEEFAKSLGMEHPDYERLQFYVSHVRSYPVDDTIEYAKKNLAKWIEDEQECYYGTFESTAHFVKHFLRYYDTEARIPDYVKVDYDETWNHHFYGWVFEEPYGYVWADIF